MAKADVKSSQWGLALQGPDAKATVRWLCSRAWPDRTPEQLVLRLKPQRPKADWQERIAAGGKDDAAAYFTQDRSQSLVVHPNGVVKARFPFTPNIDEARRWLEDAPFELASFDTLHSSWSTIDKKYRPPSFGDRHFPHGWGCAFKGAGHERLVSRRWLEVGPWVLVRGKSDLSLVQFHALDANAKEALKQAKPGHKAMGISDEGGFLQRPYVFEASLSGLYDAGERTLKIVVLGREPSPVELRDARAAVKQGALTATQPLERIAYVFPDPAEAERHLNALWARELECRTIVDGVEKRLDLDYRPPPVVPGWAAGDR